MQLSVLGSILLYVGTFGFSGLLTNVKIRNKYLKFLLIVLPPILLATFRHNVGYDYGSYIEGYNNMFSVSIESIFNEYTIGDPIAFNLITKFATLFNSDRVYLMILAILSIVPGVTYIYNEWPNSKIKPLMIFIFLFCPFIFSFSACKQGIALNILMFSLKYVFERKPVKFLVCIFIAFLFHSTAIIFLSVYFFLNKKSDLSNFKKVLIIIFCLIAISNLELILSNFMGGRYESYAVAAVEGKNRTFWLYFLLAGIFVIFRKKLVLFDKRNEMLIMMMLIGAFCQYLGFYNAFTKRIGEYFIMSQVFLIPQCSYLFTENSRKIVNILIILYIIAIFIISSPTASSGMGFIPYQFSF